MPTNSEAPVDRSQNSTPPMGLVVLPSGLIEYQFEGVITALGISIPEAENNLAPEHRNSIDWVSAGQIAEDIFGGVSGPTSLLNLRANWQRLRENGILNAEAMNSAGTFSRLQIIAEAFVQAVAVEAGAFGVTLINGVGNSSFPRLAEGVAERFLTMAANVVLFDALGQSQFPQLSAVAKRVLDMSGGNVTLLNGAGESQFARLSATRKQIDWGIVTALPATTNVGDTCVYKAATGIYWSLVYTGEATYPWAKIGGPPLQAEAEGEVKTASTGFVALAGGPELSAPLAGEYDIETRAFMTASNGNSSQEYSYSIGGVEPVAADSDIIFTGGTGKNGSRGRRKPLTKGQAVAARYRSNIATMEAIFKWRELYLDPVRVG